MPIGEQRRMAAARAQRLAQAFPVMTDTPDAATLMSVDALRSGTGQPPSDFSQTAMRLAAHAAQMKNTGMPLPDARA